MTKKVDLRVIKTKKSIYESFITIMEKKSFEEIRVCEICEEALINRSTFYAHFEDKYDLFKSLMTDMKNSLRHELDPNLEYKDIKEFYMKTISLVLEHLDENKDIFLKMINNNRNSVAMDMIYDTLKEGIQTRVGAYYHGDIPVDIITNFYVGGIANVLMLWLVNPHYTKDDINEYLDKLIFNN